VFITETVCTHLNEIHECSICKGTVNTEWVTRKTALVAISGNPSQNCYTIVTVSVAK